MLTKDELNALLRDYQTKLESRLDILLTESGQAYDDLVRAARYSLLSGGKRLRPILLLEFYRLCGGEDDCAYHFAAALEMIHTYSLIHDDLPCMDNDDLRRGKPACHKQFGEDIALLAGDALLTEAFGVAAKTVGLPPERILRAIGVLSAAAGISGMAGGQVMDLQADESFSAESIRQMVSLKTGALIRAAAVIGCVLAGADESVIEKAALFGEKLGFAFQVTDDLLDFEGDEALLGKPVGSDEKNDKHTIVGQIGVEEARKLAAQLTEEAVSVLQSIPGDSAVLYALTEQLLDRNR